MYNTFPWELSLSSLLGYREGFVPPKEDLGVIDPTYDLISKYGKPSENWSVYGPNWSPLQAWEMWLHKPEPIMAVLDQRLSSLINPRNKEAEIKPIMSSIMDIVRKLQASKVL